MISFLSLASITKEQVGLLKVLNSSNKVATMVVCCLYLLYVYINYTICSYEGKYDCQLYLSVHVYSCIKTKRRHKIVVRSVAGGWLD